MKRKNTLKKVQSCDLYHLSFILLDVVPETLVEVSKCYYYYYYNSSTCFLFFLNIFIFFFISVKVFFYIYVVIIYKIKYIFSKACGWIHL